MKLSLFADDMILYIENPKDSTRKLTRVNSSLEKLYLLFLFQSVGTSLENDLKLII